MAIDANTAEKKHFKVGEAIRVIARGAEQRYRISGIAKFGGGSSLGGATMAIFDFPVAQAIFDKRGELDSISIAAQPGYSHTQLLNEIRTPAAAECGSAYGRSASGT